jgi:hypothetical protein
LAIRLALHRIQDEGLTRRMTTDLRAYVECGLQDLIGHHVGVQ